MKSLKKLKFNRIYFIGIGGISMSALAKLCIKNGVLVAGSDITNSNITKELMEENIKIFISHNKNNIVAFKPDLVVYSNAINYDNEELIYAKQNDIKVLNRAQFLGLICDNYNNVIAIAGTHGKTTTTAIIGEIFVNAGFNPTIHIGGEMKKFNSNLVVGNNDFFITEACEYKNSFKYIKSDCAVITNIENEHLDYYKNFNNLFNAFVDFMNSTKQYITTTNSEIVKNLNKNLICNLCGDNNTYNSYVANVNFFKNYYEFDYYENNKFVYKFKIKTFEEYDVYNAMLAISVARFYNIKNDVIAKTLLNFGGVKRRCEYMGEINNIPVYSDYCHHPTEITKSIQGFKRCYRSILCIFQPHTYSRTKLLKKEFKNCFKGVKQLIVFKTYSAREKYDALGSETNLYKSINHRNKKLILDYKELDNYLIDLDKSFDVIIVLGAGDLYYHFEDI